MRYATHPTQKTKKLLDLKGTIFWEGDLNAMRENKTL